MPPPQNPADQIRAAIGTELQNRSLGVRSLEQAIGLKRWCLRGIMDSSRRQSPSLDRADEICRALGITLTLGAGRDRPRSVNEPLHSQIGPGSDLPRCVLADVDLAALVRDVAGAWDGLTAADRVTVVRMIEVILDGVRSRPTAPDRRAGRPAAGGE